MGNLVRACHKIKNTERAGDVSPWTRSKHKALGSGLSGLCIEEKKKTKNQNEVYTETRGFLVEIQGDNGTFKHFLFFKQLREVKPAESWQGRPEEGLRKAPQSASLTRLSRWMERTSLIIYTLLMKRVTLNLLQTRYTHETLVQGRGKLIR